MAIKTKKILLTKEKASHWFFFIPLGIILATCIGLLIATGISYSFDFKVAEEVAKGLNTEFGKFWSRFYDSAGNTELIVVMMIYIAIFLESIFLTKIAQKKNGWKKTYWIMNGYYPIVILAWTLFNIINITLMATEPSPFGPGIDSAILDSIKYRITGSLLGFTYQTVILIWGLWYVRSRLVATNRILEGQYWVKSVKVFTFFIICYIIIVVLKGTMSRFYYYNSIFGELFAKIPKEWQDNYIASGSRLGYGVPIGNGEYEYINDIPWDLQYPWWKSYLPLVHSNPAMPHYTVPSEFAFPSGHTNAFFGSGSLMLLFVKNKNNTKTSWKIKICFVIWLIHLISMKFGLIMERFHWISDTAFTIGMSILMLVIVHFSINKIFAKRIR